MNKFTRLIKLIAIAEFIFSSFVYSAPDLTLTSISNTPTSLGLGQIVTVTMAVQNIGTSTAAQNHIAIYINTSPNFTNAILLSTISLESLTAGVSSTGIQFVYPVPYNVPSGTNYILVSIDALNEVTESDETNNNFYCNTTLNISSSIVNVQKLPYPIIFIHGLNDDNNTWNPLLVDFQNFYGWSFGGNLNFCLNQDANLSTSDMATDYFDWSFLGNIISADFYTVNFNVGTLGLSLPLGNSFESNQAGVVKQGLAIRDAITHVLQVTGRNKVILVGHSMGGLAAREYLQDSNIWQPDGQNHVAKLLTVGTPNGGSNATFFGLGGAFTGVDELSEAVRDLRYSYYSGHVGVYLFSGNENTTDITGAVSNIVNVDVNCNGVIFENITGIDYEPIPSNISYSCIIGTGDILGGDGIVAETRANLNIYPGTIYADTFRLEEPSGASTIWHSHLQEQTEGNVQGIDEANEYSQSYGLSSNQLYFGLITKQSLGGPYVIDYDDYKINASTGNLNIKLYNVPLSQYSIDVYNSSFNSVFSMSTNGKSYINANTSLAAGQYYFELSGTPTGNSWYFPYAFKLTFNPATDIQEIASQNYFHSFNYPNPFQNTSTISFTLPKSDFVTIKVYNLFGQLISTLVDEQMNEGKHEIIFDGSTLASGIYIYSIQSGSNIETHKLNIEK